MEYADIEKVLQTYTLEEIVEFNNSTPEDLINLLVDYFGWVLPNPKPLDVP